MKRRDEHENKGRKWKSSDVEEHREGTLTEVKEEGNGTEGK